MTEGRTRRVRGAEAVGWGLGILLLAMLLVPIVALLVDSSPTSLAAGVRHPAFGPALWLSLRTTSCSLAIIVVCGTPLAWWLSRSRGAVGRVVEVVVDLPIVMPPAVLGVALLATFGRHGLLGPALAGVGLSIPFSTGAVVIAQVVVASPFFVQAAANAFRKVDDDMILVARTLGASSSAAFFRVAVPVARPGLLSGAALCWARAAGEFGATLLFAGNLVGRTQTMPLAIYSALETDVRAALALALVLAGVGGVVVIGLRFGPSVLVRRRRERAPGDSS